MVEFPEDLLEEVEVRFGADQHSFDFGEDLAGDLFNAQNLSKELGELDILMEEGVELIFYFYFSF